MIDHRPNISDKMSCVLKIEPHIRGHIASCNGQVDRIGAKSEQCRDSATNAINMAALIDTQVKRDREKKKRELETFQKRVRQRAVAWERRKHLQIAASTTEIAASEQKIAEQAATLDKVKPQISIEVRQDVEDIRTLASASDTVQSVDQTGDLSASQMARNKLLMLKGSNSKDNANCEKKLSVHFARSVQYEPVTQLGQDTETVDSYPHVSKSSGRNGEQQKSTKFTNPGLLEMMKKKQAATQYLLFRRLYSDIERQQARQKYRQQTQAQKVQQLKRQKEAARRLVEDEVNTFANDSCSTASTEATEDRERAREWTELMILEERKQKLQKSRENERYTEALKARLKEKLKTRESALLPVCACGSTLWDADASTCANNCPFYRNPKALEKALTTQLRSFEL